MEVTPEQIYVTHFDFNYLQHFLALYSSIREHSPQTYVVALCIDNQAYEYLSSENLVQCTCHLFPSFFNNDIHLALINRSKVELIWTLTPYTLLLTAQLYPETPLITYIDADMFLLSNPLPLTNRFLSSGKDILFTNHNYPSHSSQSILSGIFCVQYLTIRNPDALDIVSEWFNLCLTYCPLKPAPELFGDQKYLDYLFQKHASRVYVTKDQPDLQAPWNMSLFKPEDAIAFHFHSFRMYPFYVKLCDYQIPSASYEYFYKPYIAALPLKTYVLSSQLNSLLSSFIFSLLLKSLSLVPRRVRPSFYYRFKTFGFRTIFPHLMMKVLLATKRVNLLAR